MLFLVRPGTEVVSLHLVEMSEDEYKLRLLSVGRNAAQGGARCREHGLSGAIHKENCVGDLITPRDSSREACCRTRSMSEPLSVQQNQAWRHAVYPAGCEWTHNTD